MLSNELLETKLIKIINRLKDKEIIVLDCKCSCYKYEIFIIIDTAII